MLGFLLFTVLQILWIMFDLIITMLHAGFRRNDVELATEVWQTADLVGASPSSVFEVAFEAYLEEVAEWAGMDLALCEAIEVLLIEGIDAQRGQEWALAQGRASVNGVPLDGLWELWDEDGIAYESGLSVLPPKEDSSDWDGPDCELPF